MQGFFSSLSSTGGPAEPAEPVPDEKAEIRAIAERVQDNIAQRKRESIKKAGPLKAKGLKANRALSGDTKPLSQPTSASASRENLRTLDSDIEQPRPTSQGPHDPGYEEGCVRLQATCHRTYLNFSELMSSIEDAVGVINLNMVLVFLSNCVERGFLLLDHLLRRIADFVKAQSAQHTGGKEPAAMSRSEMEKELMDLTATEEERAASGLLGLLPPQYRQLAKEIKPAHIVFLIVVTILLATTTVGESTTPGGRAAGLDSGYDSSLSSSWDPMTGDDNDLPQQPNWNLVDDPAHHKIDGGEPAPVVAKQVQSRPRKKAASSSSHKKASSSSSSKKPARKSPSDKLAEWKKKVKRVENMKKSG